MKFLADENFNADILHGILAQYPGLNIQRVQDINFRGADDVTLLQEAATQVAIILTHDVKTMTKYAYERVRAGLPMPGALSGLWKVRR